MKKGISAVFSTCIGAAVGAGAMWKVASKETNKAKTMSDKHLALFLMMTKWVQIKQEKKSLADYLEKNHYKTIVIYGMSYAGECLLNELKDSNITVKYGIDKSVDKAYTDIDVVSPDEVSEDADVDAVIVTPIFFMNEIEEALSVKISCPILSLEDILDEMQMSI